MRVGVVLLARMGASRLPGKVLLELCGRPVLEHIIIRLRKVRLADDLVVATTTAHQDDALEFICSRIGVKVYRGSEENVLERCIGAASDHALDAMIRLGADCPFVDSVIIDGMMEVFLKSQEQCEPLDYVSNSMDRSFPIGLDADIIRIPVLHDIKERIQHLPEEKRRIHERNVISFLHANLSFYNTYAYRKDKDDSHLRWTLDTPEDYRFTVMTYEALFRTGKENFSMYDVFDVLKANPELIGINSAVVPVTGFWTTAEREKHEMRFGENRRFVGITTDMDKL